ncbi:UNVERIFIED_ORG: two-component system CheB/CheR fusion protein [Rhizobium sp. SORGH_AS260]|nr:two-component system CheB/CheR fusion protein [Rhizobium sp. SORGH_AS_0285]MDP9757137.1 two-component system CheB/CheR fusion protein [Rhizobium sp. SORGH_AS_0260]MDR6084124.1 two-component system CheB/CheR fusion protein [Agrobacterium sp. SORGH_AS_0440]
MTERGADSNKVPSTFEVDTGPMSGSQEASPVRMFPIVGVGASSGGLNAFRSLLKALPEKTGCAFLLVQHLDRSHESMLAELLASETNMVVTEAVNLALIEPEHVYVIPPKFLMSVDGGRIYLSPRREMHEAPLPFDVLLGSMVKEYGPWSIAVVLSGTGSDGSSGVQQIRDFKGLVLVQEPQEAQFDGMPESVISLGIGATVLPVAEMPAAIAKHIALLSRLRADHSMVRQMPQLDRIIEILRVSTANDFSAYKHGTMQRRVEKRIAVLGIEIEEIDRYLEMLENSEEERQNLVRDLLINVTSFFRDGKVFDFLRDTIIPDILHAKAAHGAVRVWVAGCSTGEEAYSLAILFLELIQSMGLRLQFQMFASDADGEAVAIARDGHYSHEATKSLPTDLLEKYFVRDDNGYTVTAQLRGAVVFTVQNVLSDPPFSRIDLISCRNLLIYLEADAQAKVLSLFRFALRENGILLVGKSETVGGMDDRFKLISETERVYRRIGPPVFGDLNFGVAPGGNVRIPSSLGKVTSALRHSALADAVAQVLLGSYVPAAILVNRKYEYLYSIGPTARFLRIASGPASHDLFAMTPKALHNKIRSAIHRATRDQKPFVAKNAKLDSNGAHIEFSIHVEPLFSQGEELFLICFVEDAAQANRVVRSQKSSTTDASPITELEFELEETRAELQGAIRNLEIASEEQKQITAEALSLNEEYQSTNEELVTSKEELQSLNEELTALNNQLHEALERQRAVSNDLQNVLYSTDVPTLFLDASLRIRFFTPATRSVFKIISSDVGRPLSDLSGFDGDISLQVDAMATLQDGNTIDREIGGPDGRWYVRRIKPYRGESETVDGVVITFIDMSAQKQVAESREAAKKSAERATEAKSQFLSAASHDLRQPLQTLKLLQGLLEKSVGEGQARTFVQRMEETLSSMLGILNSVLDINQIEAGMVEPQIVSFAIGDLLGRLFKEFYYPAQAAGLQLHVVPSSLAVRTDPRLFEQIVRNLLSNALKYTTSGKILVGCRRRGTKVRFEVWDTGIGIPENHIEDVFQEYLQLDAPAGTEDRGLGLGLSIVKRLSELLELRVVVQSRLHKGSAFMIEIDHAPAGEPLVPLPAPVDDHSNQAATLSWASVLIVEDENGMRDLLKMGLEQTGYVVAATSTAAEALAIVRGLQFTPDVILADYNLPTGGNGIAAIGDIRQALRRNVPALILTGDISSKALRAFAQHEIPYLHKPAKLKDVVQVVETLVVRQTDERVVHISEPEYMRPMTGRLIEVIDDQQDIRDNLRALFEGEGWTVATYVSAEEYLADYQPDRSGCLLVDAYLPGMVGMELLRLLKEKHHRFPVIVITGRSDVRMAINAMRYGAADFIEKPFSYQEIYRSVQSALERSRDANEREERRETARATLATLTRKQRQILDRIVQGQANKVIAADLKLSQRTVENHRASIMRRTKSASLPALLRLVLNAEE